ncbi:MAG TPA: dual specificity protein phosphatase family protein [Anaerolineae bacterium]|nr:dual specificity protein phosphatase family protein [Anaerolineae bacterium]
MQYIYWVIEKLLAGRPGPVRTPWDPAELYAGGFRAIVSLAAEEPIEDLSKYGFEHYRAAFPPLNLFSVGMRKAFIYEALPVWDFIHTCLEAEKPVLVHCHAGADRTGLILAGYLVVYCAVPPDVAIVQVRAANPAAMAADGYAETVTLLRPGQIPDRKTLL